MSFTEDELQSFHTILEQKLSAHRREMERAFEQRINVLRRDLDQRLNEIQQDIVRIVTNKLVDQQSALNTTLSQMLSMQQTRITQAISQEIGHRQERMEGAVDRTLAAQLSNIEHLLDQRLALQSLENAGMHPGEVPHFEAIEVQTELLWEDLVEVIGKALDERLLAVRDSTTTAIKNWEQQLSAQLHLLQVQLREEFLQRQTQPSNGNLMNMEEVFQSIEQLERLIESMQVAMTSNHALLAHRLYHHQQLPLERAHPGSHTTHTPSPRSTPAVPLNGMDSSHSASGEHAEK